MTYSSRLILASCFALFFVPLLHLSAADNDKKEEKQKGPDWNVRVEMLMVAMPEEKFITLLPDLLDEAKIGELVPKLLEAVKKKEMILRGYPIIVTKNGQRAVIETIEEIRYPTEFTPPTEPQTISLAKPAPAGPLDNRALPTAFETRNAGVTLEVESVVSASGDWIELNMVPQQVELLGFDPYGAMQKKNGEPQKDADPKFGIVQPRFFTMKLTTSATVRNGQHMLLGVHKMVKPDGYVDVFIVRAVATQIK